MNNNLMFYITYFILWLMAIVGGFAIIFVSPLYWLMVLPTCFIIGFIMPFAYDEVSRE